jgi:hypothetical protein
VTKTVRALSFVGASAVFVAWFVSLAVRASVGAMDTVTPRFTATGGIPIALPPLAPLVLPRRDPFAADQLRVTSATIGRGGIAGVQVPDPSAFARNGGAASLGVIGVIVGDQDAYALVENGAQIQVVHVKDAFAGSTVTAITEHGVVLANGITLDVDAVRSAVAGGMGPAGTGPGGLPTPGPGVSGTTGAASTATQTQSNTAGTALGNPTQTTTPSGPPYAPGSAMSVNGNLPSPLSGNSATGSLFPLLQTPAPLNGVPHQ